MTENDGVWVLTLGNGEVKQKSLLADTKGSIKGTHSLAVKVLWSQIVVAWSAVNTHEKRQGWNGKIQVMKVPLTEF
jgi:hypothetical protein